MDDVSPPTFFFDCNMGLAILGLLSPYKPSNQHLDTHKITCWASVWDCTESVDPVGTNQHLGRYGTFLPRSVGSLSTQLAFPLILFIRVFIVFLRDLVQILLDLYLSISFLGSNGNRIVFLISNPACSLQYIRQRLTCVC